MKKIKCQGHKCKKKLIPGVDPIWFYRDKNYCQECYIKLIEEIEKINEIIKNRRKIATSRSKSNKKIISKRGV